MNSLFQNILIVIQPKSLFLVTFTKVHLHKKCIK